MAQKPAGFPGRLVRAGGAVVFRRLRGRVGSAMTTSDFQVLLVHRPNYRDWSFPKGKANLNEPLPVAAVREVEEETGVAVRLHVPLPTQRYRLGSGVTKEVHYWVGSALTDSSTSVGFAAALSARAPVVRASRKEIDRVEWFFPEKAREKLTRRGDRRLLDKVVSLAEEPTGLETGAVIYLRHGEAISRKAWAQLLDVRDGLAGGTRGVSEKSSKSPQGVEVALIDSNRMLASLDSEGGENSKTGSEASRPLSRLGGAQALDLVALLSAFGVSEVWSSPWLRCLQTVWPYATLSSVNVQEILALTEMACAQNPGEAKKVSADALRVAGKSGSVMAVSLHRPTLPTLLQPVREKSDNSKPIEVLERPKSTLRTAEMFVVHVSHKSVLAVERQTPLTKLALGI